MNNIKISAYTKLRNGVSMGYPFVESITSMSHFADEIVVVDNGSTDGTKARLEELATEIDKIKLIHQDDVPDETQKRFGIVQDGEQKAFARSKCSGDVLFQFDCDEVIDETDSDKVINCCHYVAQANSDRAYCLPIVEYWGRSGKIRCDIPFFKPRISMNGKGITHGIPSSCRKVDIDGNIYSSTSDGCDYISADSFDGIPLDISFINVLFEKARSAYFAGAVDKNTFLNIAETFMLNSASMEIPLIHHYSWFNLNRKIKNYRDYWGKHWSSVFDDKQGEQNFFFEKSWSNVSEAEIKSLAKKLEDETAGWIFHKPIDFKLAKEYRYVYAEELGVKHPRIMRDWIGDAKNV